MENQNTLHAGITVAQINNAIPTLSFNEKLALYDLLRHAINVDVQKMTEEAAAFNQR